MMRLQTLLALPFLFTSMAAQARLPCDSWAACAALEAAVLQSPALRTVNDPELIRLIESGHAEEAHARAVDVLRGTVRALTGEAPSQTLAEAQLARLLVAESAAYEALVARVADYLCDADDCVEEADRLVRESGLLHRELVNEGVEPAPLSQAVQTWVSSAAEPADAVVDRTAWIIVAEDRFKTATGFEEGTKRADLEAAALMLSGGATMAMDVAQPTCSDDGLEGPGDLFGGCGMPDAPQMPDTGGAGPDPVPTSRQARGGGRSPTRQMPRQVGSWDMPGACYGLDPRKVFDGAGAPEEDGAGDDAGSDESESPRLPSVMDKKPVEEKPTTSLPPEGTKPPADGSNKMGQDEVFDAIVDLGMIPIGGGLTFDLTGSLDPTFQSAVKGEPTFTFKFNFRPAPDGDAAAGMCGERFAAVLAGCLGIESPGGEGGPNRAFNLVCGDTTAPVQTEGPRPAGCDCMGDLGGAPDAGEGGADAGDDADDVGELDCCPGHCFVASNRGLDSGGFAACGNCAIGPECAGADANVGSLVEGCAAGLGEPLHSQMCGAIDPSPLEAWFGEPMQRGRFAEPTRVP